MKLLITGGCGFVGTNVALKINEDFEVFCLDDFSKIESNRNKELLIKNNVKVLNGSVTSKSYVDNLIDDLKPDFILHLAAQVAMTNSIDNPLNDLKINLLGTFNLLNAVKEYSHKSRFINISTNKVYGDLSWVETEELESRYVSKKYKNGFDENIPLSFSGPYGCSKGAAEQYTLDFVKTFDLHTTSLRLSTIYGPNQYATFNQGWIGWFLQKVIENQNQKSINISVHGDGKQVRDILFVDDFVRLIEIIINNFDKVNGEAFNVGGSLHNSLSILELLEKCKNILKIECSFSVENKPWRPADQKFYVSDIKKIKEATNWSPKIEIDYGLEKFVTWMT